MRATTSTNLRPRTSKHARARRRVASRGDAARSPSTAALTPEQHAQRVAHLHAAKQKLAAQLRRVNVRYEAALIAARRDHTAYAVLGQAVQQVEGRPQTAEDLKRVERQLRKATAKALRRRDPAGDKARGDTRVGLHSTGDMARIIRKRVVEEWYEADDREHEGAAHDGDLGHPGPDPDDDVDDLDDIDDLNDLDDGLRETDLADDEED